MLAARVQILEDIVQTLADLPARVTALEAQFVQFRSECRREFAAIRGRGDADLESLRREIATKADLTVLRLEMVTKVDMDSMQREMATKPI